jgi:hypothetical protein
VGWGIWSRDTTPLENRLPVSLLSQASTGMRPLLRKLATS